MVSLQERVFYLQQNLKSIERSLRDANAQLERLAAELLNPPIFICDFEKAEDKVLADLYHFQGHVFGDPKPERKGMNHTSPAYRICTRCGRSDTYLLREAKDGVFPACK